MPTDPTITGIAHVIQLAVAPVFLLTGVGALLVCTVIAMLFIDAFIGTNLKWLVGALFVVAMVALIGGLVSFLREVYFATHTLRIGPPQ